MEYTPGIKINQVVDLDAKGVDRKLLAKRAVESYLQQLLTFGFFHAGERLSDLSSAVFVGSCKELNKHMCFQRPNHVKRQMFVDLFEEIIA